MITQSLDSLMSSPASQSLSFSLKGLLRGHVGMLIAAPNVGKSHLALCIAMEHASSMSFLSQEMSLNIDINRILPVKVSGVCPKELSRLLILSQSCNDVSPGKIFHSNSADSPLTSSKSL